ncbi:MAG TPA: HD-GYP domain-containing protein [Clostridiales bacterium]|nr:HD-GYP domain-containing protein [Clostridiales bacterium]HOL91384.1 HD-GYP domain-containing protein [Clostridiales bacterium]HPP35109.1 HD-GYP domain-containing protein [Clostridiales bacterium]
MRRLELSQLKPGMRLAKDVILPDGRLLLLAGFIVKPLYLRKLEAFNVDYVYVEDGEYEPFEEFEEEKLYNHAAATIKNIFTLARRDRDVDIISVMDTVNDILNKVMQNETVMLQLTGIRDIDNYTFLHSVDVCIYSIIIGKKLGYGREPLMTLGMGAILHDIGKCKVPIEILQKPDRLTDDEFHTMKLHTVYGYEIIKNSYQLSTKTANIAFQHHEKWDGSGYPMGISDNEIDPLSRIVALADVYDALTSDRVYKKRELPHVAAEYIKNNAGVLFDPYIVDLFVNSIAVYTEGTLVLLSTGEVGSVVSSGSVGGARQKISVFSNKSGPPVLQPYIVDLNERTDVEIVEVFM